MSSPWFLQPLGTAAGSSKEPTPGVPVELTSLRRWRVSPGQVLTPRAIPQPPGATLPSLASLLLSLGYFSRAKLSEQTLQTVGLYPMCDNPLAIH